MGMRELDAAILAELRGVTGLKKLRQMDIMEWSTTPVVADKQLDEKLAYLPTLKVHVAYTPRKK